MKRFKNKKVVGPVVKMVSVRKPIVIETLRFVVRGGTERRRIFISFQFILLINIAENVDTYVHSGVGTIKTNILSQSPVVL
jgi:hypothetical protein